MRCRRQRRHARARADRLDRPSHPTSRRHLPKADARHPFRCARSSATEPGPGHHHARSPNHAVPALLVLPAGHSRYRRAWPAILADTRRIIDAVRTAGVAIAGPDGRRSPILDPTHGVGFNGDAYTDLDGDPFTLLAPTPPTELPVPATASCRTGRKPYDLAVAAVLLRCHLLLPDLFTIGSDGRWDVEWAHGPLPTRVASTLSARQLVASLFDTTATADPLRPIGDPSP